MSVKENINISNKYDFSQFINIVELVNNADKPLLVEILSQHKKLNGLLFGQTNIIEELKKESYFEYIKGRCRFTSGNYNNYVPYGFNLYLINFADDLTEEQLTNLLNNIFKSTELYTRVLFLSLNEKRNQEDYISLIKSSNFLKTNIIDLENNYCLIEALRM